MAFQGIHLTDELVQAVRDAVDIVDIASEHTRLTKAGRRHKGLCPLHKEKTPSFSVDPDQGLFYCFGCSQGGDAIKLHMQVSGDDFPAAIETLARRYGIPVPAYTGKAAGKRSEEDLEPVLEAALEFYRKGLVRNRGAREYLEQRSISEELIDQFGLGFARAGWRNLLEALSGKFPDRMLLKAGLVAESRKRPGELYDRFRERLIFPIRNTSGRLVGFGGRAMDADAVKYINTSETARFRKGRLLYGLDLAKREIRESGKVLLVEGYFDVIGSVAAGIPNAVASMGTALTPEQAQLLARFADDVVVGYDGDEAGVNAYRRSLPLLLAAGLGTARLELAAGADPDSVRTEDGAERLLELYGAAPDAVLAEIRRLAPPGVAGNPRQQAAGARSAVELLKAIPDTVLRYGYARQAAEELSIPVNLLLDRLAGRQGAPSAAGRSAAPGSGEGIVRSLEEKALHLLLTAPGELPAPDELPPPEAFLDPTLRNIFEVFQAFYRENPGRRPDARELMTRLPEQGSAVDRVARLLLEDPSGSDPKELVDSVRRLERRWQRQKSKQLAAEITQAQRAGDQQKLERLLTEKAALSRRLHERSG